MRLIINRYLRNRVSELVRSYCYTEALVIGRPLHADESETSICNREHLIKTSIVYVKESKDLEDENMKKKSLSKNGFFA